MNTSFFVRVILIPSAVFLSVVFGGSYGSGREVVEFISKNGPQGGLVSTATIFLTYSVCLFLCFELARMYKVYEYRNFFKVLLGKAWFLYEIIIMLGLLISLAVCASTSGSIVEDHFQIPEMLGGLGLLSIVAALNYLGRDYVERSMIFSVSILGLLLVYLLFQVFTEHGEKVVSVFSKETANIGAAFGGMQYAFTNAGFIPLLLYCCRGLETRSEVLVASCFASFAAVIPGIAFHITFMVGYPEILDQRLPTYWLMEQITSPLFLNIYVAVLFIMVAQTGVGLLQGVLERIDVWMQEKRSKPLPPQGHFIVASSAIGLSMLLSIMGIVNLIIRGYAILSVSFILVFFIPLFTFGVYRIFCSPKAKKLQEMAM